MTGPGSCFGPSSCAARAWTTRDSRKAAVEEHIAVYMSVVTVRLVYIFRILGAIADIAHWVP